jgi:presenilin-like A22 family membrane protease
VQHNRLTRRHPVFGAILLFVAAEILTLLIAPRENSFFQANNVPILSQPPQTISLWPGPVTSSSGQVTHLPAYSSLGPIVIYFLAVTAGVAVVLSLIPLSALRLALRFVFAFLLAWGAFITFVYWLPLAVAIVIASCVAVVWFLIPRLWFHDLAMVLALGSVGVVFGRFITPWTALAATGALAIYDAIAVRRGFMMWLTGRLSKAGTLPALVIPKNPSYWNVNMRQSGFTNLVDQSPAERDYSIVGGGDIAFPCLLTASVYFAYGLPAALIVTVASLAGLVLAYVIQAVFLKGRPTPALPPIAALALVGLLIVR